MDHVNAYMLLCPSANRAKSWSCEHCPNWVTKDPATCKLCYWAYPESYSHVATREVRRLDVMWTGEEVEVYDGLSEGAAQRGIDMPDYVKEVLAHHINRDTD